MLVSRAAPPWSSASRSGVTGILKQERAQEELEELQWQHQAPYIEPTSYLVKDDGSGCLDAVGKHVVFIKEGFFEQCKAIKQQQIDPRWTSIGLRRWQNSWLSNSKQDQQQGGIGYAYLGLIERCKVVKMTFHRRKLPEKPEQGEAQGSQNSSGRVWDPVSEPQAGEQRPPCLSEPSESSSEAGSDADPTSESEGEEEEEEEPGDVGRYFVRLTLQRLPQKNDRLGPVCSVIDHYVDSGIGEWIIPRERYNLALARQWKRGDRIQMYWADQASSGRGQWWEGTVVGYVKRAADHPFRDSPWAAVTVKWSETRSKDNISPWELSTPEDEFRPSSDSEVESDWEAADAHDESQDEDWELQNGGFGEEGRRLNRKRRQEGSPLSDDSASSFDYEPSKKRARGMFKDVPETMLPRKSKGTVDWNKGHCAVCMTRPDGSLVVECDGTCLRSFHTRCLTEELRPSETDPADTLWHCADCRAGLATCAVCRVKASAGRDVLKCKLGGCGNYFHPDCLRQLAAVNACVKIHRDSGEAGSSNGRTHLTFTCPCHFCHRCHLSGDSLKIYRCWTCLKGVHGKCMDRTETKLNEKEMECCDCAAAKTAAHSRASSGPSATPEIPVWQPGKPLEGPSKPKVSKWTASITEVMLGKKVDLVGKAIFHFGSHKKGGGCDFLIPVQNVKFHSELKVLPDGNVVIAYCHNRAREMAEIRLSIGSRTSRILSKPEQLQDGELITIANTNFKFQLRPWNSSHTPLLLI